MCMVISAYTLWWFLQDSLEEEDDSDEDNM